MSSPRRGQTRIPSTALFRSSYGAVRASDGILCVRGFRAHPRQECRCTVLAGLVIVAATLWGAELLELVVDPHQGLDAFA